MQPLAPCALSLEGTVLGASQITWVGGRTVLSAIVALSFFSLVSSQGWALPGIWAGLLTQPQHLLLLGTPSCPSHFPTAFTDEPCSIHVLAVARLSGARFSIVLT